jgi:hypothetical protein
MPLCADFVANVRHTGSVLPNLIVIGAERCGTTSLHRYLGSHPQVFMSAKKELNFFVAERNWRRGRTWYERRFSVDVPVRGESSPAYTAYPQFDGVPARIAGVIPSAKLVYLVRDPVERTISALHLARALGLERRTPAEALRDADANPYLARSRYATQPERYLAHFPKAMIMMVDAHELRFGESRRCAGSSRFLNVEETAWRTEMEQEFNSTQATPAQPRGTSTVGARAGCLAIPARARSCDAHPRGRPCRSPAHSTPTVVDPALRGGLVSMLADEAARLRA